MPKKKTLEEFLEELKEKRPDLKYVSGYEKYTLPVKVQGKKCKHTWDATPKNLFGAGKSGCPECAPANRAKHRMYTQEEFEAVVAKKFPNIRIESNYLGHDKPITYSCANCGKVWSVEQAISLTYGRVSMHANGECGTKQFPAMSDAAVRADFEAGMKRKDIAAKYGCSIRTAANRLKELGLTYHKNRKNS